MTYIGVLALQGAFIEHIERLQECIKEYDNYDLDEDINIISVRTPEELEKCKALIIPGGESTSMSLIAQRTGFLPFLRDFVNDSSKAIWGTCAGLIFLSETVQGDGGGSGGSPLTAFDPTSRSNLVEPLNLVKVRVKRNAFGRQAQSFTKICDFSSFIPNCTDFPATFIRAPVIEEIIDADRVKTLYTLPNPSSATGELIVAAKQDDNVLVTAFHPELAENDIRFHDYFIREYVLKNL
ncbi:hypothetical protein Kpol_467p17 [Vanderwaltozyma polyspora DSM 70294]|uniref:glutaminase n=1 Tax=Vanderwaltozyma polyspora (strain ATCC 22028 / DSM 70294 / BCRC 21397 / CBS 2163 / NBRC 10782 / NRRL Y-8283 / UCD 57-17) TaxID=436907 RepID=A7TQG1_VANPO|nr:uncharacterized protein Kpol_467p17 [Vanderwaltozyma polyspora DSM 70294]EDO15505.1 hypothetical protein Kpol_467p17 [Vanderwaltozyma polyspora DSM 70294]